MRSRETAHSRVEIAHGGERTEERGWEVFIPTDRPLYANVTRRRASRGRAAVPFPVVITIAESKQQQTDPRWGDGSAIPEPTYEYMNADNLNVTTSGTYPMGSWGPWPRCSSTTELGCGSSRLDHRPQFNSARSESKSEILLLPVLIGPHAPLLTSVRSDVSVLHHHHPLQDTPLPLPTRLPCQLLPLQASSPPPPLR